MTLFGIAWLGLLASLSAVAAPDRLEGGDKKPCVSPPPCVPLDPVCAQLQAEYEKKKKSGDCVVSESKSDTEKKQGQSAQSIK